MMDIKGNCKILRYQVCIKKLIKFTVNSKIGKRYKTDTKL